MRRIRKILYFFYPGSYAILDKKNMETRSTENYRKPYIACTFF